MFGFYKTPQLTMPFRALQPLANLDIAHRGSEPDDRVVFQINDTKITLGDVRFAKALVEDAAFVPIVEARWYDIAEEIDLYINMSGSTNVMRWRSVSGDDYTGDKSDSVAMIRFAATIIPELVELDA